MNTIIAITMGDPSGVGSEVILKALSRHFFPQTQFLVFGDYGHWERIRRSLKIKPLGSVDFVDVGGVPPGLKMGRPSKEGGKASGDFLVHAINAALRRDVDALVTAPINKISFLKGGWGKKFIGHTEMLAALTKSKEAGLMLVTGKLRALHVTSHVALKDVPRLLSRRKIFSMIRLAHEGLELLGIRSPRIGVAALNPHAGDGGLMGKEEKTIIAPAIAESRRKKIRVSGPIPADVLWPRVLRGEFDVGLAMYHDQGQIAVKLVASGQDRLPGGVNVTLGLPIVRTSPAHGTAYDIAGRGKASEKSFVEAIRLAAAMAGRQRRG